MKKKTTAQTTLEDQLKDIELDIRNVTNSIREMEARRDVLNTVASRLHGKILAMEKAR